MSFFKSVKAYAKVNLSLGVLSVNADAYHEIYSLISEVNLFDRVGLSIDFKKNNICEGDLDIAAVHARNRAQYAKLASLKTVMNDSRSHTSKQEKASYAADLYKDACINVSSSKSTVPSGKNNIAYKAVLHFFCYYQLDIRPYDISVFIDKHIPSRAGLGGGSSDAAACWHILDDFFGCNKKCGKDIADLAKDQDLLSYMALFIGADVPYCYVGGTCFVQGVGEKIETLPAVKPYGVVLVKKSNKLSTAVAYKTLDKLKNGVYTSRVPKTRDLEELMQAEILNDFSLVMQSEDEIYQKVISELSLFQPLKISLSGSGPTQFALFPCETTKDELVRIADKLRDKLPRAYVYATFLR